MIFYVNDPKLNQRILYYQEKHGFSREKLCQITGMSENLYDDIENGRELDIPYEVLRELCGVFFLKIEELFHPDLFPPTDHSEETLVSGCPQA